MPERFQIYMVCKMALYKYSSFPFRSRVMHLNLSFRSCTTGTKARDRRAGLPGRTARPCKPGVKMTTGLPSQAVRPGNPAILSRT